MNLKNKKILITAGPTWVPIDKVRVISNIATGETGVLLAKKLQELGAKVTLLLGPVSLTPLNKKIRLINFKFFDELRWILKKELTLKKYDFIIHSAAVSDFKPTRIFKGKFDSRKPINLKLKLLPKLIADMRRLSPNAGLVMFKLGAAIRDSVLIEKAKAARQKAGAEIVVANRLNPYQAFIIDGKGGIVCVNNKRELVSKLVKKIGF
jgi:phosphopantothenoylcysteine decarboxylase/phosphopantothenate--cysteine ligase